MRKKAYGITDIGIKRENNEDSFLIIEEKNLYIVADGMGGHTAGEVASLNAVKLVDEYLTPDRITDMKADRQILKEEMINAVFFAHNWILKSAKEKKEYSGMGTTIVVCFIDGNVLYTCHVGDSRAYIINTAGIQQITNDHSYVGEQVRSGMMTSEQARHSRLKNQITQALGSPYRIKPEYNEHQLDKDSKILLCSDGLWDMLSDNEIHKLVIEQGTLDEICKDLIIKANIAGGNDNITVILIKLIEEDQELTDTILA
jgi:serine/threonine protein phosphatase PrpC